MIPNNKTTMVALLPVRLQQGRVSTWVLPKALFMVHTWSIPHAHRSDDAKPIRTATLLSIFSTPMLQTCALPLETTFCCGQVHM